MVIGKPSSTIMLHPIPSLFTLHLLPPSFHENCIDSVADVFHRPSDFWKVLMAIFGLVIWAHADRITWAVTKKTHMKPCERAEGKGKLQVKFLQFGATVTSNGMYDCCPTCWLKSMAFEVSEPSLEHLYDHTCDSHFAPHVCVDQLWLFHLLVGDGYQLTGTKRSLDPATRPKRCQDWIPPNPHMPPSVDPSNSFKLSI